ncbi:hypothetical protein [Motilimonas eburnea]|uniref:hypothetical protein n=1 Tax=Motilimonas eburnea TaxID=1737488 RepID=UPI001E3FF4FD|nr:hypothetical protein [Motilimonas eburnea]MCE2572440.1 hypothetical protein [Motilimonas eburnea]
MFKNLLPPSLLLAGWIISLFFYQVSDDGSGSLVTVAISVVGAVLALAVSLVNKQGFWLSVSAVMMVLLPIIAVATASYIY